MALPWHTSVSILVAGGMVSGAVYLALRPSPSPEPTTAVTTERAVDPFATSPMAERDRQRRWDDEPTPESAPAPSGGSRGEKEKKVVSEAEQAMAVAPPLGVPSTSQEVAERLQQDAGKAYEGIRKRVRTDCWDTLPDDPEAPDQLNMMLSLSYGADGRVIASGINESRDEGNRGGSPRAAVRSSTVAACLSPLIHGLDVPAPGSNLSVELSVTIP